MGQGLSCGASQEHGLFTAVQFGELEIVEALLERDSSLLRQTTAYDRQSVLHIAAANGQIEVILGKNPSFFSPLSCIVFLKFSFLVGTDISSDCICFC